MKPTGFVTFLRLSKSAIKPKGKHYPQVLKTIGDHIKAVRLDGGLTQEEVANIIGVHIVSIRNWELGHHQPDISLIPSITDFLGYDPGKLSGDSLHVLIYNYQRKTGLRIEKLAPIIGIQPLTLWRASKGQYKISKLTDRKIRTVCDP